ncbi:hypothetical protein [Novosphingobium panipatense]|nr:hypothetical protein [Novosphingobium panipatense]
MRLALLSDARIGRRENVRAIPAHVVVCASDTMANAGFGTAL